MRDTTTTVEQKDFIDQGGTVQPRERFAGAQARTTTRSYGSLKGTRSAHRRDQGEPKVSTPGSNIPNWGGVLATAGNLVFLGLPDGTFSAHEAKTLPGSVSLSQCLRNRT
jgi:hypothetical protein